MPRIIILGTGTDVGKTYVTRQLACALASHPNSISVLVLKPIESGLANARPNDPPNLRERQDDGDSNPTRHRLKLSLPTSDAELLAQSSTHPVGSELHAYAFPDATSPHLAARRHNKTISLSHVAEWIASAEQSTASSLALTIPSKRSPALKPSQRCSWTLIETAGAVMTPLGRNLTNLDLAVRLEPAIWILVAPDRLGVLHDLTATLCTMRHLGRIPDSLVLNAPEVSDPSTGTNAAELGELRIATVDASLGRQSKFPKQYVQKLFELARTQGM